MKKYEVKEVVKETMKEVNVKKVVTIAGIITIVAATVLVCRKKFNKQDNEESTYSGYSDKEIDIATDFLRANEGAVAALKSFNIDVNDITLDDVIVNEDNVLAFMKEGIIIKLVEEFGGYFNISVYRDPLYDFMYCNNN